MRKPTTTPVSQQQRTDYPVMLFDSQADWHTWLAANHSSAPGVSMRLAKKAATYTSVNYAQALDVVLCYGWIDGQLQRFDDESYLTKFTPRGPRSIWSKVNAGHVERLIASGAIPETRAHRISEFVAMLDRGETIHPVKNQP